MAMEASIDHSLQESTAYREMMGSLHTRWFLNGKTSAHGLVKPQLLAVGPSSKKKKKIAIIYFVINIT